MYLKSVKGRPTLDFGSGYDLMVCGIEPCIGLCVDGVEPACDSLPLSLPLSRSCVLVHARVRSCACSLDINKLT